MQQKLFKFFLPQEAGAFRKKHRKETAKATPKIEKKYVICLQIIFVLSAIQCTW